MARQMVANGSVYEAEDVRADAMSMAFRAQLTRTQPLSNRPVIRQIWAPLDRALSKTVTRGESVAAALTEAAREFQRATKK